MLGEIPVKAEIFLFSTTFMSGMGLNRYLGLILGG